jgi:hypothetical protein
MSIGERHRNFGEIFRVAASERVKPGAILIAPWQIDANQDSLGKGLDECGCAFCPDDDQKTT